MKVVRFIGIKEHPVPKYKKEYIPTEYINGQTIMKPVADVTNVQGVDVARDVHIIPIDKIEHLENWKGYRINGIETTEEQFELVLKEIIDYGKEMN